MKHVHMGPDEAVRAHNDLGRPTLSVGIHWGTFMMSDEHYLEPPKQLREAWQKSEADREPVDADRKSDFITTAFGETVRVER
jgi:N-acyl-phosphatidylethanolamine-hydrolysing phospholipase D